MPCDLTKELPGSSPTYDSANDPRINPDLSSHCMDETNTFFFYSNRPETLTAADMANGVLWRHNKQVTAGDHIHYRVFLWHKNGTGEDVKIGLTLENKSTDSMNVVTVTGDGVIKRTAVSNGGPLSDVGRCIAQAQLGNTLDPFSPQESSVAGSSVGVITEWTPLPNN